MLTYGQHNHQTMLYLFQFYRTQEQHIVGAPQRKTYRRKVAQSKNPFRLMEGVTLEYFLMQNGQHGDNKYSYLMINTDLQGKNIYLCVT